MMISEKPVKSKALEERSFNYECRSAIKDNLISIKEVTINPPDDPGKKPYTRKLMLCYLLRHYFDHISGIDTVLKNRDNELGCPLLQIFYCTKAYGDIKYALQKFLAQRKAKKEKTIESALELMIIKLVTVNNTLRLPVGLIWNEAINTIPGRLPPRNQTNI